MGEDVHSVTVLSRLDLLLLLTRFVLRAQVDLRRWNSRRIRVRRQGCKLGCAPRDDLHDEQLHLGVFWMQSPGGSRRARLPGAFD